MPFRAQPTLEKRPVSNCTGLESPTLDRSDPTLLDRSGPGIQADARHHLQICARDFEKIARRSRKAPRTAQNQSRDGHPGGHLPSRSDRTGLRKSLKTNGTGGGIRTHKPFRAKDFKDTGEGQRTKDLANSLPFSRPRSTDRGSTVRGLWTPIWTPGR